MIVLGICKVFRQKFVSNSQYFVSLSRLLSNVLNAKGEVIPTPEPASEPDFRPSSTPNSDTNSFPLEPLEPVPRSGIGFFMDSAKTMLCIKPNFGMLSC